MPALQVVSSVVELAINTALGLARNSDESVRALSGKCCTLHIQEVDITLSLHFSLPQKIDGKTSSEKRYVDVTIDDPWTEAQKQTILDNHAYVSISINALPELKKTSQLTRLIKLGKLDFYGDLYLIQKLSALFDELDIDLAEVLSQYIGDVPAHWLFTFAGSTKDKLTKHRESIMQALSDAALEEKPIAVRPIMLMNFIDEVKILQAGADRVAARIEKLEKDVN